MFRQSCILAAIALALSSNTIAAKDQLQSKWNLRDHIRLEEVVVQSHRGAGVLSPENSIEAFDIAWKYHTIPEVDLRTTSDGIIVAFHDKNFARILPTATKEMRGKGIEHLTFDEVGLLDIGEWKGPKFAGQRVPSLEQMVEVLRKHPERRLYIDIKNVDLEQLARETTDVHSQLILASTDYAIIRKWRELAPRSATLHWMGGTEAELVDRIAKLRESKFADITQLQIHVRIADDDSIDPSEKFLLDLGSKLREREILFQALPWHSTDPKHFWRLMDLGVASFATDYPDVTMQAIRDYYQQRSKSPTP